ncbi:methionine aminopeptidase 1c [Plasmodium brasilianum]|uniref:Methionine aminopeptidase 1c n=1 Tax=Plasmodium brasilianum TaxID=5824 RepID=A0ACB9YHA0_PLABR|nr:methionine aminopeptidase 1c [Plasmodium brasilianum]
MSKGGGKKIMNVHILLLSIVLGICACKRSIANNVNSAYSSCGNRGDILSRRERKGSEKYVHNTLCSSSHNVRIKRKGCASAKGNTSLCCNFIIAKQKEEENKKKKKKKKKYLNSSGEGFSNTCHHDVKKNTKDYSEDILPSYHRYIENFKTRKIIHPSIRISELDKKFMKCKDSYNKLYSHLKDSEIFENFSYVGRQKKGIQSPKYYLPKYIERPNYHKTGMPIYVNYENSSNNNAAAEEAAAAAAFCSSSYNETVEDETNAKKYEYKNVKDDEGIEIISRNCKFARELMDDISYIVCEGITTNDIDIYILNKCVNNGFYPSPLNYHLFPKSSCVSINEILCHGIPDNNVLFENDIVKVDISVYKDNYHADMCESFLVEKITKSQKKKRKRHYDFIYLNDKFRTKYTKYILKYNFDLIKNKVVKKGKYCSVRKIRYVAPNSKDQQGMYHEDYDDNTNVIGISDDNDNDSDSDSIIRFRNGTNNDYGTTDSNVGSMYDHYNDVNDELENFHKQYDQHVIFNPPKNHLYNDIQKYIYNNVGRDKDNKGIERKHLPFFDRSKLGINDFKKFMYEKNIELIKTAYECTMEAINVCKPGVPFKTIAEAMDSYLQKVNKKKHTHYTIVPNLCGHNIGKNFHEEPFIMHTLNNDDRKMCENLVFTIEPIISERPCGFITWPDNWTISNARYYFSAQFEHTIHIKKNGVDILTKKNDKSPQFIWEKNTL